MGISATRSRSFTYGVEPYFYYQVMDQSEQHRARIQWLAKHQGRIKADIYDLEERLKELMEEKGSCLLHVSDSKIRIIIGKAIFKALTNMEMDAGEFLNFFNAPSHQVAPDSFIECEEVIEGTVRLEVRNELVVPAVCSITIEEIGRGLMEYARRYFRFED